MNDEILAEAKKQQKRLKEILLSLDVHRDRLLAGYIWNYISEELSRDHKVDRSTIEDAIDAFNGGAR